MENIKIFTCDHPKVKEYLDVVSSITKEKKPKKETIGIFAPSDKGFGFVDTKEESFYINEKNTMGSKKGDRVRYKVVSVRGAGKKSEAVIEEIISTKDSRKETREAELKAKKKERNEDVTDLAIKNMKFLAQELGANAVISFRMTSTIDANGVMKIVSYGTAVKI